jgi:hypothetical protein
MALIKLFWNYVICGRGELPPPQRKPPSRFAIRVALQFGKAAMAMILKLLTLMVGDSAELSRPFNPDDELDEL